jgi:hypothetical protein
MAADHHSADQGGVRSARVQVIDHGLVHVVADNSQATPDSLGRERETDMLQADNQHVGCVAGAQRRRSLRAVVSDQSPPCRRPDRMSAPTA